MKRIKHTSIHARGLTMLFPYLLPDLPFGGNGDSDEGFVLEQLSMELLEVLEFPLHLPCEFPMC